MPDANPASHPALRHSISGTEAMMPAAAEPTTDQRKALAKSGYAMHDGSYYIRPGNKQDLHNAIMAVGRGAGGDPAHDAIRRHIMTRACAGDMNSNGMNCKDMIPGSWNADGSLMHSDLDAFLEHFGVKGMHWGQHRSQEQLRAKANEHELKAVEHIRHMRHADAQAIDLERNGVRSEPFKKIYGQNAWADNQWTFYGKSGGQTKQQALNQLHVDLRTIHNHHARMANHHSRVAKKLRKKAEGAAAQSSMNPGLESDSLEHFGVKGMHWGVRKNSHVITGKPSADAARAQVLASKVKSSGGVHGLSNKDLQSLVTRMNLEQQYGRLETGPGSRVDSGRKFVAQATSDGRLGVNAYKTGKEVAKILGPILLAAGAAAAANKATGGNVRYYHPSSRKAISA